MSLSVLLVYLETLRNLHKKTKDLQQKVELQSILKQTRKKRKLHNLFHLLVFVIVIVDPNRSLNLLFLMSRGR